MMARLGDVCDVRDGTHDSPTYVSEGYPLVTSKNIVDGKLDLSLVNYITFEDYCKINERSKVDVGDIIMPMIGTIGNPYIVEDFTEFAIKNVALIKFNNSQIQNKYIFYFLNSEKFKKYILKNNRGGTQKFLSLKDIRNMEINVVPLQKQKEIVERLDKINFLISARKQQLQKLDELVRARFVELFGDYDLSHAKNNWKSISEIGKVVGGATPKTNVEEYWDGEYRWITPAELGADSGYIYDSLRKLTKAGVESCSLQEMPINTVILSSRAPIGKVAIAGNTFYCNQGFKNIICNKDVLPIYIYTVLLLNTEYLNSLGRGATFKEISKSIVENIKISVPPIELQNQFVTFVEKIDKSKFEVQQSLEKLETLKKALMQNYFG
ncbi:MAG: restriction endonuclease subunit S [Clostridia bacterium]|nr:restriction endonuclease subunit S [Clostridia bacterium]